jgi:hypothetical protein
MTVYSTVYSTKTTKGTTTNNNNKKNDRGFSKKKFSVKFNQFKV